MNCSRTSVDAGAFDSHPDPHLSYDQMLVDDQGWRKLTSIINSALLEAIKQLECFPRRELVRLLDAALEGMRAQPPDSHASDYREMRSEVKRLLREAEGS